MRKDFADISSNNPSVNLKQYAAAKYPLVAIKLGGGKGDQWDGNPQFFSQWQEAGSLGLARWCYWYWRAEATGSTGYDQAIQVIRLISGLRPQRNDRIVLDFETMLTNPGHNNDQARQFIDTLQRGGHTPLLYASPGFLSQYNNPQFGVDLWIADYASKIWNPGGYKIAAWQHSTVVDGKGIGSPPYGATGIGYCDMNVLTSYGIRKHLR
jgi:GH25 family lysozyme M1 (1,4-beta-N-acetylmuramidase)